MCVHIYIAIKTAGYRIVWNFGYTAQKSGTTQLHGVHRACNQQVGLSHTHLNVHDVLTQLGQYEGSAEGVLNLCPSTCTG